jgi:hypothetical protein
MQVATTMNHTGAMFVASCIHYEPSCFLHVPSTYIPALQGYKTGAVGRGSKAINIIKGIQHLHYVLNLLIQVRGTCNKAYYSTTLLFTSISELNCMNPSSTTCERTKYIASL